MSLRISTNTLLFDEHKNKETLRLENLHSSKIIFKVLFLIAQIKISNIQLFNIYPGKGFIEPSQSSEIQISVKKVTSFQAKLMVLYAPLNDTTRVESYEVVWNSLDKKQFKDALVQINIKTGERPTKSVSIKQTESPVYEPQM